MGRNKLIYALSRLTFVVASDKDKGGTWAGATEALDRGYAPVAVWASEGASEGNAALLKRGATPISAIDELFALDHEVTTPPLQETLF
jgi:predicted Rossmann fold nucleotide-binding protein DprA/Smf involved in DNA uptake